MIVSTRVEITDEERNRLAVALDGRPTTRLATRAEVRDLMEGALRGALDRSAGARRSDLLDAPPQAATPARSVDAPARAAILGMMPDATREAYQSKPYPALVSWWRGFTMLDR
ncbi:MAG: hypothetical protein ACU85V_00150 [Gammaproteobacteria bacterium]